MDGFNCSMGNLSFKEYFSFDVAQNNFVRLIYNDNNNDNDLF